ncbi:uncharacterized protein VTP21DRAFT_474 [Calcarisporiella thermophila]|uniref:uncharacterized protein n=1 Tax=Calcarisporiella thermophila TaxID=911321 RepID=UPI003743C3D3
MDEDLSVSTVSHPIYAPVAGYSDGFHPGHMRPKQPIMYDKNASSDAEAENDDVVLLISNGSLASSANYRPFSLTDYDSYDEGTIMEEQGNGEKQINERANMEGGERRFTAEEKGKGKCELFTEELAEFEKDAEEVHPLRLEPRVRPQLTREDTFMHYDRGAEEDMDEIEHGAEAGVVDQRAPRPFDIGASGKAPKVFSLTLGGEEDYSEGEESEEEVDAEEDEKDGWREVEKETMVDIGRELRFDGEDEPYLEGGSQNGDEWSSEVEREVVLSSSPPMHVSVSPPILPQAEGTEGPPRVSDFIILPTTVLDSQAPSKEPVFHLSAPHRAPAQPPAQLETKVSLAPPSSRPVDTQGNNTLPPTSAPTPAGTPSLPGSVGGVPMKKKRGRKPNWLKAQMAAQLQANQSKVADTAAPTSTLSNLASQSSAAPVCSSSASKDGAPALASSAGSNLPTEKKKRGRKPRTVESLYEKLMKPPSVTPLSLYGGSYPGKLVSTYTTSHVVPVKDPQKQQQEQKQNAQQPQVQQVELPLKKKRGRKPNWLKAQLAQQALQAQQASQNQISTPEQASQNDSSPQWRESSAPKSSISSRSQPSGATQTSTTPSDKLSLAQSTSGLPIKKKRGRKSKAEKALLSQLLHQSGPMQPTEESKALESSQLNEASTSLPHASPSTSSVASVADTPPSISQHIPRPRLSTSSASSSSSSSIYQPPTPHQTPPPETLVPPREKKKRGRKPKWLKLQENPPKPPPLHPPTIAPRPSEYTMAGLQNPPSSQLRMYAMGDAGGRALIVPRPISDGGDSLATLTGLYAQPLPSTTAVPTIANVPALVSPISPTKGERRKATDDPSRPAKKILSMDI